MKPKCCQGSTEIRQPVMKSASPHNRFHFGDARGNCILRRAIEPMSNIGGNAGLIYPCQPNSSLFAAKVIAHIWMVASAPGWPVFMASTNVRASALRNSPSRMRSG
jgi:hypothetical protein